MRKLIIGLLGLAGYMSMVPTAHAGGNFEFSVQAEADLMLVIAGFAPDGTQIFKAGTIKREKNNAGLQSKGVGMWCAFDLTGKWKLLPKGQPSVALCDDSPSEVAGRYFFASRIQKNSAIIGGLEKPTADQLATIASRKTSKTYDVQIDIDTRVNFEMLGLKGAGNKIIWQSGAMGAKTKNFTAKIPKVKTKNMDKVCVRLTKGWIVRDQSGKPFSVSCFDVSDLLGNMSVYSLAVEKQ